jgi:uncharacterized protein (DUF736 family)
MENNNKGALFIDNKRTNEKAPQYRGNAMVNGVQMKISAWVNVSQKDGSKYLSLKFEETEQQQTQQAPPPPPPPVQPKNAADDIIDFLNGN